MINSQLFQNNCQPTYWIPFLKEANLFQYGYHDMVESSMRGKFWLFFKIKVCNIYYKVDIE